MDGLLFVLLHLLSPQPPQPAKQPARPETPARIEQKPEPKKAYKRVTENDALALAVADIKTVPVLEQQFIRYIWITDADQETMQAVTLALNYVSRASVPVRPVPLGKDGLMLLRVNLRFYAPSAKDLEEYIAVYEDLQFDPRFNLLITQDMLKFAQGVGVDGEKLKIMQQNALRKKLQEGGIIGKEQKPKFSDKKDKKEKNAVPEPKDTSDVQLLRVVSEHLNKDLVAELIQATQSQAPIVSHEYYIARAMSSIEDDGVYKIVYGGLYYRFSGIRGDAKEGTDEDVLLEGLGIGSVKGKVNAQQLFDKIRSDQRIAVFRSNVTGRPRRVDVFPTLIGRDGTSIVSVTHDLKQKSIDLTQSPIANLIDFKDDARELIFSKSNGLLGYALFNGQGKLQAEAPFDVALDTTLPAPHGGRLESCISCLRCHGKFGGWQPLTNDVKKLLAGFVDVFGDLIDNDRKVPGDVDRIAGLYSGDLELTLLPRARADLSAALLRTTGPWKQSKDQTDIVAISSAKIGDIFNHYKYDLVTASTVLRDLAIQVGDQEDPNAKLKKLLPPVNVVIDGVIPEDPIIAAIVQGIGINRIDYDLRFSFIASRVQQSKDKGAAK